MADRYYTARYTGNNINPNNLRLELHIYTVNTDVVNNKTTERADLYMVVENASGQWYDLVVGDAAYIGVNGHDITQNVTFDARTTGVKNLISTWDTVIQHNNDGSANGVGISAYHSPRLAGTGAYLDRADISGTYDCDVIPRYPTITQSLAQKTMTSITMNWYSDSEVDYGLYSLDGGTSWTGIDSPAGTSGSYTITGLQPNTTYSIIASFKRLDSQLRAQSSPSSQTTYDKARFTEAPNITIGQNATIKYNNTGGATLSAYIEFVSSGSTITVVSERAVTGNQYTFQFTSAEIQAIYSKIPSDLSGVFVYVLKSVDSGGTFYDTASRTFYVDTNTSKPAFGNFEYRDVNSTTTALTGDNSKVIKGYNEVSVIVSDYNKMSPQNGATASGYTFKNGYDTRTFAAPVSGQSLATNFNNIETSTIEVIATDSRSLSTSVVKTIPSDKWIEYEKHWISGDSTILRIGGVGTTAIINLIVNYWNNSFGAQTNTITEVKYKVLPITSSNWDSVSWTTLPSTAYSLSNGKLITNDTAAITNLTVGTEYHAMFQVTDLLDTATEIIEISAGDSLISVNKTQKMVGIGKLPDTSNLYSGTLDVVKGVNVNDTEYGSGFLSNGNMILKEEIYDSIGATVVAGTGAMKDSYGAIIFRPWHALASVAEAAIINKNNESEFQVDHIQSRGSISASTFGQKSSGTLNSGAVINLQVPTNFVGLISLRLYASNIEVVRTWSFCHINRWAYQDDILTEFNYGGTGNASISLALDPTDQNRIVIRVTNTSQVTLTYIYSTLNML